MNIHVDKSAVWERKIKEPSQHRDKRSEQMSNTGKVSKFVVFKLFKVHVLNTDQKYLNGRYILEMTHLFSTPVSELRMMVHASQQILGKLWQKDPKSEPSLGSLTRHALKRTRGCRVSGMSLA